jgi:4-hydroxybenzoate polyprenyltransferase/geranylgeranylglycerol-phosphate geranylgeranyltransferase
MLYVGIVGLAGAFLAAGGASVRPPALLAAWLAPTLGWVAGHYGGDYFDRRLDAVAKPHRPIPSGRMGAGTALIGMVACAAAGGVLAVLVNWRTAVLVGAALALGIGYSTLFKPRGLSGNLVRGSLTALVLVFGAMMVAPLPPLALLPVAGVFWLHDAASNLVGTLRDVDGDRAAGYATFPVRHGVGAALLAVAVAGGLWLALAALSALGRAEAGLAAVVAFWALLGCSAALAAAALVRLALAERPLPARLALAAHEVLAVERVILAGAFVGLAAGPAAALAPVVPSALITALTQGPMRAWYEFGAPLSDEAGAS